MYISKGAYSRKIRGDNPRNLLGNAEVAQQCQAALKAAYGNTKSVAKDVADDSGQSPRAAENWLAAENPMGLTAFVNAYRNNPEFAAWARKLLLMEQDCDPEFEVEQHRFMQVCAKRLLK